MAGWRVGGLYSRDTQGVIVEPKVTMVQQPALDFGLYGYLPGVAQAAQADPGNPNLVPQPPFTVKDLAIAKWFTTRAVVKPLGDLSSQ